MTRAEATPRRSPFAIDLVYGLVFIAGFAYLALVEMDARVAAFEAGIVIGYFLRVWEKMTLYEQALASRVSEEAQRQVASEVEAQIGPEVEDHVDTEMGDVIADEVEDQVGPEVEDRVAEEFDERLEEEARARADGSEDG
jgi:hypothetical protein